MPDIPDAEVAAFAEAWLNNPDCSGGDCDDSACPVCIAAGLVAVAELRDRRVAAKALRDAEDRVRAVAERLEAKAKETGDRSHYGTAAGVRLACLKLIELEAGCG